MVSRGQAAPAAAAAAEAAAAGGNGGGSRRGGAAGSSKGVSKGSPSPGKKKKQGGAADSRQQGSASMKQFFTTTARCLGCKAVMPSTPASSSSGSGVQPRPAGIEPGLCANCRAQEGKRAAVYLQTVQEQVRASASFCAAHSACRRCHSGGLMGGVVCENGECPVLYARFRAEREVRNTDHRLQQLEW
jgi:hypothetical protein